MKNAIEIMTYTWQLQLWMAGAGTLVCFDFNSCSFVADEGQLLACLKNKSPVRAE